MSSCSRSSASSSSEARRLDLEPDDVAAAPPAHLALDQLEVRAAAFVVELELGVARQADDRGLENRLAGKQLRRGARG